jgi:hypothetical protein
MALFIGLNSTPQQYSQLVSMINVLRADRHGQKYAFEFAVLGQAGEWQIKVYELVQQLLRH